MCFPLSLNLWARRVFVFERASIKQLPRLCSCFLTSISASSTGVCGLEISSQSTSLSLLKASGSGVVLPFLSIQAAAFQRSEEPVREEQHAGMTAASIYHVGYSSTPREAARARGCTEPGSDAAGPELMDQAGSETVDR